MADADRRHVMPRAFRSFVRPVSTTGFDQRLCQLLCYAGALVMLVFGILAVSRLGSDGAHLLFGLLLVLVVAMLGVVIGTLVGPSKKAA